MGVTLAILQSPGTSPVSQDISPVSQDNMWHTVESNYNHISVYTLYFFSSDLASFMLNSPFYLPTKPSESLGVTECTQWEQYVLGFSEFF